MAEFGPPKGSKENPAALGPFPKGMNNVQPRHALPDGFARDIVNADLSDGGIPRRRPGYARQIVGSNITAAWANGDDIYFVDSGTLYKTKPGADGGLADAGVIPNTAGAQLERGVAFVDVAGRPVLGDSFGLFSITESGLERFTYDSPSIAGIGAAAGSKAFLVAVTGALPDSETQPSRIERVIGDFPITISLASYDYPVNVYVSKPDGTVLYWRERGSGEVIVNSSDQAKRPLMTEHAIPTPPGSIMRYAFGRLFSVVGGTVFYSLPYYPSVCSAVGGFLAFPRDIAVFEPLDVGFLVATDSEIGVVYGGSPDAWEYKTKANYGAVPGTSFVDKDGKVFFYTPRGAVSVNKGGELENLFDGRVEVDLAASGAAGIVQDNGMERLVTAMTNAEVSRAAAATFMEFEVIRKEVIV